MPGLPAQLPRLNLLGTEALLGLAYRALAGTADPLQAQLSLRRMEHCASELTVSMQRRSQLRGAARVAQEHAVAARRDATRQELDLELYNERYPPPPAKRGLLAPRRTSDQKGQDVHRLGLGQTLDMARKDATDFETKAEQITKQLALIEQHYAALATERETLDARFRSEVAAGVLGLVSVGEGAQAREVLADGRRALRGDVLLAALWVLVALFADGDEAAADELKQLKAIWEQHPDPVPRLVTSLLALRRGEPLTREARGIFARDSFTHAGLWRLYLLVGALAGWPTEDETASTEQVLLPTLDAVRLWAGSRHGAWAGRDSPASAAAWAAKQDTVCRVIVVNLLLGLGKLELVPSAAGFPGLADIAPLDYIPRPKRGQPWPPLLPNLEAQSPEAWPVAHRQPWAQALACHVLLAAQPYGPTELFEQWHAESTKWRPNSLYWWVQAHLLGEPGMLSNIRSVQDGLFALG
jgi:hypothetical protein